jgi:hypothetical protein
MSPAASRYVHFRGRTTWRPTGCRARSHRLRRRAPERGITGALTEFSQAVGFSDDIAPTVLRLDGLRVAIYSDDHRPAPRACHRPRKGGCVHPQLSRWANQPSGQLRIHWPGVASGRGGLERGAGDAVQNLGDDPWHLLARTEEAMQAEMAAGPRVVAARYYRRRARVFVSLDNGLELAFPPDLAAGLDKAAPGASPPSRSAPLGSACIGRSSMPTSICPPYSKGCSARRDRWSG